MVINFTLTSLRLNLFNTSGSNSGNYTINLYNGNLPSNATLLRTGTWSSLWNTNSTNSVTVSGLEQELTANTTYWIGVTSDASGALRQWAFKDTNLFRNNTNATNYALFNGTSWSSQGTGHAMGLEINGETTAVPLPATLFLFSMAAAIACILVLLKPRGRVVKREPLSL